MTNVNRFEFPGFTTVEQDDTATHEVEVGKINDGGVEFVVTLIRHKHFTNLSFLLANIAVGGKQIWDFKSENFTGQGLLAQASGHPVIAFVGMSGKLERVTPFSKLVTNHQLDLRSQVVRKREAAEFLSVVYLLTPTEVAINKVDAQRRGAEQKAADEKAEAERKAAKEARIKAILSRTAIDAVNAKGAKYFGIPATEKEWPSLPGGTKVILVDRINEDGSPGTPVEAFVVRKVSGKNPAKDYVTAVVPPAKLIQPRVVVIEHKGGAYEVQVYPSKGDIDLALKLGLNGGTFVALEPTTSRELEVFSARHEGLVSVGNFMPLA